MNNIPKEVLWYGKKEPLPKSTSLKAGKMKVKYEAGSIRNIKLGDFEVVRMIYVALRDDNWGTIIPTITEERIEEKDGSFFISYEAIYRRNDIQFDLHASISGSNNNIVFEIEGVALSDFLTNRTGFCLLHPTKECRGKTGKVISPNGKQESFVFPELISPDLPVKNIQEMSWPIEGGGTVEVKFEGEVFEMEDQRNWTDDSYKTFCRPLHLPFPYTLKQGERVRQRITLTASNEEHPASVSEKEFHLSYDESKVTNIPKIGIRRTPQEGVLKKNELKVLQEVKFDFYEVCLDLSGNWEKDLSNAVLEAKSMDLPLKLALLCSINFKDEIAHFTTFLSEKKAILDSILVLRQQDDEDFEDYIDQVCPSLKAAFDGVQVGAGTDGFFADLNINRVESSAIDFLSYSLNPQVHAFDNQTLVENLAGQLATVRSAKAFAAQKEIHISSVTFRMHSGGEDVKAGNMPDQIDPRQMSLFGAAWTLGSVKQLSEAGADAMTYFEAVGEKGIIMGDSATRYPHDFVADSGAVFPIFYVLKEILKQGKAELIRSFSSHPQVFEGLVLRSAGNKTIILANFTPEQINVRVDGIDHDSKVKKLDEKSAVRAMYEYDDYEASPYCDFQFEAPVTTFKIRPYGLVFVNE